MMIRRKSLCYTIGRKRRNKCGAIIFFLFLFLVFIFLLNFHAEYDRCIHDATYSQFRQVSRDIENHVVQSIVRDETESYRKDLLQMYEKCCYNVDILVSLHPFFLPLPFSFALSLSFFL